MDDSLTPLSVALPDALVTVPNSCQEDEKESWEIDTPIDSNACQDEAPVDGNACQDEAPVDSNACQDVTKEKTFDLKPVSPNSYGEGLPYAPEGWPNPGDVWAWRVSVRMNNAGYFTDREIILPKSLQNNPRRTLTLRSKAEIRRYLQSNFPDMKIETFLALFSWQVPANLQSPTKGIKLLEAGEDATDEIDTEKTLKRKTRSVGRPPKKSVALKAQSNSVGRPPKRAVVQKTQSYSVSNQTWKTPSPRKAKVRSHLTPDQVANFDAYLENLDNMLVVPQIENTPSDHPTPATTLDDEMMDSCKKKLSSLLAVDFPSLVSGKDVAEVATLASQIREDPSLNVDQLFKLKLVEQVPLAGEAFLEAKENIEEVDKFLAEIEEKKLKVPALKKQYTDLKDKISQREAEIDISALSIKEIDDQIQQLQSKRNRLTGALETIQKRKAELTSELTNVANSISVLVHDIQDGLSQKSKLELKKATAIRRAAEIQEKFITLRGITF